MHTHAHACPCIHECRSISSTPHAYTYIHTCPCIHMPTHACIHECRSISSTPHALGSEDPNKKSAASWSMSTRAITRAITHVCMYAPKPLAEVAGSTSGEAAEGEGLRAAVAAAGEEEELPPKGERGRWCCDCSRLGVPGLPNMAGVPSLLGGRENPAKFGPRAQSGEERPDWLWR